MRMKHQLPIASLALAAACLAGTAFAQQPAQIPSPENNLLSVWYGDWTYTTETFKTPISEPSTVTGTLTGHAILDGWGSKFIYNEGGVRYLEVDYYDATATVPNIYAKDFPFGKVRNTKDPCFRYIFLSNDGYTELGVYSMDGKVCTFSTTFVGDNGVTYTSWGDEIISADGNTNTKIVWLSWKDHRCGEHRVMYSRSVYIKVKS